MPKRSAARSTTSSRSIVLRPVQASAPRPIVVRTTRTIKEKKKHRKGHGRGGRTRDRLYVIGAAAALGLMDKSEHLTNLPELPFLGKAGTLAVAAYFGGKWMKSPLLDDAATGFACIGAYELAKQGHIDGEGGEGFEGGI